MRHFSRASVNQASKLYSVWKVYGDADAVGSAYLKPDSGKYSEYGSRLRGSRTFVSCSAPIVSRRKRGSRASVVPRMPALDKPKPMRPTFNSVGWFSQSLNLSA